MYELIKKDGRAKRGRLTTVHGVIETPVFMNVGTVAAIKGAVSTDDLKDIGTQVEVEKETNHSGGVLGGMSDGSAIVFRAAIKPTPSIAQTQKTVNRDLDNVEIEIHGRHDPMIVPRAVVVVESMAAVTILDGVLKNLGATMDNIKKIYGE